MLKNHLLDSGKNGSTSGNLPNYIINYNITICHKVKDFKRRASMQDKIEFARLERKYEENRSEMII